ncbi:MAG: lipopolysaccharide biosynthesis protein [Chloroflexi bacterium]|nr:lipopolysaccharide biosynthesis protein [Chloroflexota bacterium]
MSLRRDITWGIFWVGVSRIGTSALQFLTTLVLMRLVERADFGLIGMAYLAIETLELFRELGFTSALIYRKRDIEKAADTAFYVVIGMGAALCATTFIASPYIALFFKTPHLEEVLRVLAFTTVLRSFGEVPLTLLSKEMSFDKRVVPDIVPTLGYGLTATAFALVGLGVWSLVIGRIVESVLDATLVWFFVSWRPKWRFDRAIGREMFDYGKHILGSQVLIFFITNIDDAFVGRILGTDPLGSYQLAYKLSNQPATNISRLLGQVMFPAFSRIQDNVDSMRRAFFKSVRYVSLVAIPLTAGIVTFGPAFLRTVYAGKWNDAIIPLQLLAIYGLLRAIAVNMGSVLKAGGKPDWIMYIAVLRLSVMGILLYPATKYYGIVGVSALSAIVSIVDFVISAVLTNRVIRGTMWEYVRILTPPVVYATISSAVAWVVYDLTSVQHGFISLVLAGALMVLLDVTLTWVFDRELRRTTREVIEEMQERGRQLIESLQQL